MKKCQLTKKSKKQIIITSVFFVSFSIIICVIFFIITSHKSLLIFAIIIGIAVYFFVISALFYKDKISYINNELVYLTEENELLKKNIEPINKRMEEIDKFRHDVSNYINLIKHESISMSDREELAVELLDFIDNLRNEELCENTLISLILEDKKKKANDLNIKFESKVVIPEDIPISPKDICSCFFNLIDNAIFANEVTEKTNKKWITLKSNIIGSYLIIKQSNSMILPAKVDLSGKYLTTKINKTNHGKGLDIIKNIAEKYNGFAEFETKNDVFYSTVYLYLKN